MDSKALKKLGFTCSSKKIDEEIYTEHRIDGKDLSIEISGSNLVEITTGPNVWITVKNCQTIDDLKELMRLFNINNK